jgi:hypothetical protein
LSEKSLAKIKIDPQRAIGTIDPCISFEAPGAVGGG